MTVEATVTPLLRGRIATFHLYFRTEKSDGMRRVPFKEKGNNVYTARIAGKYIVGKVIRYYMLVDDREGNQIAQYQSVQSPATVDIDDLPTGESLTGGGDAAEADETSESVPTDRDAPEAEDDDEDPTLEDGDAPRVD